MFSTAVRKRHKYSLVFSYMAISGVGFFGFMRGPLFAYNAPSSPTLLYIEVGLFYAWCTAFVMAGLGAAFSRLRERPTGEKWSLYSFCFGMVIWSAERILRSFSYDNHLLHSGLSSFALAAMVFIWIRISAAAQRRNTGVVQKLQEIVDSDKKEVDEAHNEEG